MKCDRCHGRGETAKHYNCGHGSYDAYIKGCNEKVKCRKCKGMGFTGIELSAIISHLKYCQNRIKEDPFGLAENKYILSQLTEYESKTANVEELEAGA